MFSFSELEALAKARAVGASFTSTTERIKLAEAGVVPGRLASVAETLTAYEDFAS